MGVKKKFPEKLKSFLRFLTTVEGMMLGIGASLFLASIYKSWEEEPKTIFGFTSLFTGFMTGSLINLFRPNIRKSKTFWGIVSLGLIVFCASWFFEVAGTKELLGLSAFVLGLGLSAVLFRTFSS
ncbi:hypothetical protein [Desulfovirgula thermocuniculi]|uniref:hypothetical protein n=1 Tax=Desulfovirgula thermocuniculi TaxID=348842 RepID=UPI000481E315|nr:hypothetical protein [Desulfovirgula thermocuniculi]